MDGENLGMDERRGNSWLPGSLVMFKGRGTTPLWDEPPLPLSNSFPSYDMLCDGKIGIVIDDSLYSCKIFVDGIVGWVDKVDIYKI